MVHPQRENLILVTTSIQNDTRQYSPKEAVSVNILNSCSMEPLTPELKQLLEQQGFINPSNSTPLI